jgi:hypothetical protein
MFGLNIWIEKRRVMPAFCLGKSIQDRPCLIQFSLVSPLGRFGLAIVFILE